MNQQGYRVTLAQSHEDPDAERANLQMLEDYRVEGILISACHNRKNMDIYQQLINRGIVLVFFDRTITDLSVPKVKIDDYIKAFFMVEHLIRTGRKKIVHLAGSTYIQNAMERKRGYQDALEKFHIPYEPEYVIDSGVNFADGEQAAEEQPVLQMAEAASRLMIEKLENPAIPDETVVLDAVMVVWDSTC